MKSYVKQNRYMFGLGTVGRDMMYSLVSMYLIVFLTEILNLPDSTMWWMTGAMTALRIFDAVNDPVMGFLVDNTHGRFGKFKPWIVIGGIIGGILTVLLFVDYGIKSPAYVIIFVVLYLLWDLTYGANDIAYWSMLPSLTLNQKEREKTGAFARICANVGLFVTVVLIIPVTNGLGGDTKAWLTVAIGIVLLTWAFLAFTVFGVREDKSIHIKQVRLTQRMFIVLFKNDQLMYAAISMGLFMIGYTTTTTFGTYYFKYAFKNEDMYSVFAAILGVTQLAALSVFPLFSKKFNRRTLYTFPRF